MCSNDAFDQTTAASLGIIFVVGAVHDCLSPYTLNPKPQTEHGVSTHCSAGWGGLLSL